MNSIKIKAVNFFTILTLCSLLLFCILPIHGEGEIYGKVLRLHVIANSDSDIDQSLKLEVRDALLEYTAPLLAEASSREDAADIIMKNKSEIEAVAKERLKAHSLRRLDPDRLSLPSRHSP